MATLVEMHVQGLQPARSRRSPRSSADSFSVSAISAALKKLDAELRVFAERELSEAFPYLLLDARYHGCGRPA